MKSRENSLVMGILKRNTKQELAEKLADSHDDLKEQKKMNDRNIENIKIFTDYNDKANKEIKRLNAKISDFDSERFNLTQAVNFLAKLIK